MSGEGKHRAPAVPVGIRSTAYLPELESLPGIAVMLVVAFHTDALVRFGHRPPSLSPLMGFVRAGQRRQGHARRRPFLVRKARVEEPRVAAGEAAA